jgi:hypothetical protein
MATQRITFSYDDERHTTVHLGLANHGDDSHSDYVRKCIEFYELNKSGATNQQLILERLQRIESMLKNGVTIGEGESTSPQGDDILDELLEQME